MKKILISLALLLAIITAGVVLLTNNNKVTKKVLDFDSCAATGVPIMESYPRQCRYDNKTFVENIGNELEKTDLIRLDYPRPNQVISSPLTINGEARGSWFFEASFTVVLTNRDGLTIATGIATAKNDWMTENFVPFEAVLEFDKNQIPENHGILILKKDNPSGLTEYDDALEVPVIISE